MTDQTAAMVEITIDPLRKRIRIHRETLKQLRYPAYVQFLGNTAQKSKHDTARHDIIKIWINR